MTLNAIEVDDRWCVVDPKVISTTFIDVLDVILGMAPVLSMSRRHDGPQLDSHPRHDPHPSTDAPFIAQPCLMLWLHRK